jgi:hypothetical protein
MCGTNVRVQVIYLYKRKQSSLAVGSQNCCSKVKEAMCILGNSSCAILIQIGPKRLQICSGHPSLTGTASPPRLLAFMCVTVPLHL